MARGANTPPSKGAQAAPESGPTLVQELETAMAHHHAGRLKEAKATYQEIRRRYPGSAGALHFLGVIAHQEGDDDLAVELMSKAIAEDSRLHIFHGNLGEVYRTLGRYDEAIACCRRALEIFGVYPEAHNTLGAALHATGELEEAETILRRAVEFKPNFAAAHANLGNALNARGKHAEAVAAYREALRLAPSFAGAHAALAGALQNQGKSEEAVASLRRALEIAPKDARAWSNLGILLGSVGRIEEAVESLREAIRLAPDLIAAHSNLGTALLDRGEVDEAMQSYAKALELKRGWPPGEADARGKERGRGSSLDDSFRFTTVGKLGHDVEQFEYLVGKGRLPASFAAEIDAYRSVLAEVAATRPSSPVVALTSAQQARLGSTYNRAVYVADAPAAESGPLNPALDVRAIEDDFHRDTLGVAFFDDLLTAEALVALRRFCLESTIWYDFNDPGGYLGAYLSDGLSCGLLFQIAEDLRKTLPGIFGDHKLRQMQGYKCASAMQAGPLRVDAAAVSVTLWITPDDANLDSESGGLVVFKREAPLEWDLDKANKDQDAARAFLADSDSITVPYRQNRAVVFNSNLFHETDALRFREGHENRRIDITMLFGVGAGRAQKSP